MNFFNKLFTRKSDTPIKATSVEDGDSVAEVRLLEIKSKKLSNHLFSGEYHTAFKGVGMVYKDTKTYSQGDDIRFIDWNVSARMGSTYSKVFEEERELSVFLLIDASASTIYGTGVRSKKERIADIASLLSFSAAKNNDKTGMIICTDKVEKYIPPRKGRNHVLFMMQVLLKTGVKSLKTDISKALIYLNNNSRHRSIVFILSDFADKGYAQALRIAAKKHDVIGIRIYDKTEEVMPNIGLIKLDDSEGGTTKWVDTNENYCRINWKKQQEKIASEAEMNFKKAGADLLQISTSDDYVKVLQHFFVQRVNKKGRK